jgi:hypothetical protein
LTSGSSGMSTWILEDKQALKEKVKTD